MRTRSWAVHVLVALCSVGVTACIVEGGGGSSDGGTRSTDAGDGSDAKLDDFVERTKDARVPPPPPDAGPAFGTDITGTFFLAVATHLGPTTPFLFKADAEIGVPGRLTLTLTSLDGSWRTPNADNIIRPDSAVDVSGDGEFLVAYTEVVIVGSANSITGNDLVVTLGLSGRVLNEDFFCGDIVDSEIVEPPAGGVAGTWGAVRVEGPFDVVELTAPVSCAFGDDD